jgi:hypothetical protein
MQVNTQYDAVWITFQFVQMLPGDGLYASGHVSDKVSKPKMIYHPVFVDGGGGGGVWGVQYGHTYRGGVGASGGIPAVVTPGEGSGRLSLYSAVDGRTISRGGGQLTAWLEACTLFCMYPIESRRILPSDWKQVEPCLNV